jgi:hypothetical protein
MEVATMEAVGRVPRGDGLEIFISAGKGLGVRTTRRILAGEVIEVASMVVVEWPFDRHEQLPPPLHRYVYQCDDLVGCPTGFGMLYNHSFQPNAVYHIDKALERPALIVTAFRDVECGEEITINYNGDPDDCSAVIFVVKD